MFKSVLCLTDFFGTEQIEGYDLSQSLILPIEESDTQRMVQRVKALFEIVKLGKYLPIKLS